MPNPHRLHLSALGSSELDPALQVTRAVGPQIEIGIAIEIDSLVGQHTTGNLALTGDDGHSEWEHQFLFLGMCGGLRHLLGSAATPIDLKCRTRALSICTCGTAPKPIVS